MRVYVSNIVAYFTTHTQSQRVEFNWAEIETEAETSRCQANSVVAVCLTASLTTCTHVHVHVWVICVRTCVCVCADMLMAKYLMKFRVEIAHNSLNSLEPNGFLT